MSDHDARDGEINMALANPPLPATNPPAVLLVCSEYSHHDDAWRTDFAAWKWTLPDIGSAVFLRMVESEFPHDAECRTTTEMIVPLGFLSIAIAAFNHR